MVHLTSLFLTVVLATSHFGVQAAPASSKANTGALGNLQCNAARIKTAASLAEASKAVKELGQSTDATVAAAATNSQTGLGDASTGVKGIGAALLQGQAPPADLRDQVSTGLTAAKDALDGVAGADNALKQIDAALEAGQQVIDNCGGEDDVTAIATAGSATAEPTADEAKGNQKRQIGNLQCNIARLQTVTNLAKSVKALKKLATTASGDEVMDLITQAAQDGLTSAKEGIATIAKALLTGQIASLDVHTLVSEGLQAAADAFNGIDSTDAAVSTALSAVKTAITATATAGKKVAAECK